jgi:lysophospholipase L1-like esterase
VVLVGADYLALRANNPPKTVGHHHYLALGDSLSFGFQPNFDFANGFDGDVFRVLQKADVTDEENLACSGETTDTMIHGGCIARFVHHGFYTGAQLDAAVAFLQSHQGQVSPITLEIGANDVIPDWNSITCSASSQATADVQVMDTNLHTILSRLDTALKTRTGQRLGDLHLLNYYNPFAKECPNSGTFLHMLNDHLAADAAQFRVPVVDVYTAFGGDPGMAQSVCQGNVSPPDNKVHPWTWICDPEHDIHPTTYGYAAIATAVETALMLPGTSPAPGIVPPM